MSLRDSFSRIYSQNDGRGQEMSFTGSLMIEKRFLDKDSLEKYIIEYFKPDKLQRSEQDVTSFWDFCQYKIVFYLCESSDPHFEQEIGIEFDKEAVSTDQYKLCIGFFKYLNERTEGDMLFGSDIDEEICSFHGDETFYSNGLDYVQGINIRRMNCYTPYGVYNGFPYEVGKGQGDYVLLYPDLDDGKEHTEYEKIRYAKVVKYRELSEISSFDFFAEYKGHRTLIARTKDPDVFEIYVNDHQLAVELGFDRCDKYCYNLMVNKTEIKFITKKVPCELPWRKK